MRVLHYGTISISLYDWHCGHVEPTWDSLEILAALLTHPLGITIYAYLNIHGVFLEYSIRVCSRILKGLLQFDAMCLWYCGTMEEK
jgi:hypothetical protein